MNEKTAKRRRVEARLQYLNRLERWLDNRPPLWRVFAVRRWWACKPEIDWRC